MSATGFRQNAPGYYIAIANFASGDVKNIVDGVVSSADWWDEVNAGSILKDMGTTAVIGGITYRKVQLVVADAATFGVGGPATSGEEYFTGYIILGYEGNGTPAKVACFGK